MVGEEEEEGEEVSECHAEDYEGWTMKQIRKELQQRGVDTTAECRGCNVSPLLPFSPDDCHRGNHANIPMGSPQG